MKTVQRNYNNGNFLVLTYYSFFNYSLLQILCLCFYFFYWPKWFTAAQASVFCSFVSVFWLSKPACEIILSQVQSVDWVRTGDFCKGWQRDCLMCLNLYKQKFSKLVFAHLLSQFWNFGIVYFKLAATAHLLFVTGMYNITSLAVGK